MSWRNERGESKIFFAAVGSRARGGVIAGLTSLGSLEGYSVNKPAAREDQNGVMAVQAWRMAGLSCGGVFPKKRSYP